MQLHPLQSTAVAHKRQTSDKKCCLLPPAVPFMQLHFFYIILYFTKSQCLNENHYHYNNRIYKRDTNIHVQFA